MGLQWVYCQYPCCIGNLRVIVSCFVILAIILGYCHRVCLNISLVEMVDHGAVRPQCVATVLEPEIKDIGGGKINWTESEQGYTLSSFYIGYLITHIPGGILCDIYGARYPLIIGMFISTVSTGLIPIATTEVDHPWIVFFLRILTGAGQGVLFPAVSSLVSRWIPPCERASIGSAVFAAGSFGLVVGNFGTGMLISAMKNWPIAYYLWTAIGAVYCLLYMVYVYSDPRTHPYLHPSELEYLKATMIFKTRMKIPFKAIFSDKCVWGLLFVHMGHDLIIYILTSNLPKYLNQVLGFTIRENSFAQIIFICLWLGAVLPGILADYVIEKKNVNITFMRQLYTLLSNAGSAGFIALAVIFKCNTIMALISFAFAIFMKGVYFPGGNINIVDISLNHSGFMMSIVNGLSAVVGIGCSSIVGIVAANNTFEEWTVLVIGLGVFEAITLILYMTLCTANRSAWDYPEGEEPPPKKPGIKWYLQMTNSDHEIRKKRDRDALIQQREAAKAARQKMKELRAAK